VEQQGLDLFETVFSFSMNVGEWIFDFLQEVDAVLFVAFADNKVFPSDNDLRRAIVRSFAVQLSVIAEACSDRAQHLIIEMQAKDRDWRQRSFTCSAMATLLQE
jgi:hypothetical protein